MQEVLMDIDLLAKTLNQKDHLEKIFKKICNISSNPDDAIRFNTDFSNHPDKQNQWNSWIKKMKISSSISLPNLISELRSFLLPIFVKIKEINDLKN
jgi:hypothetical protein